MKSRTLATLSILLNVVLFIFVIYLITGLARDIGRLDRDGDQFHSDIIKLYNNAQVANEKIWQLENPNTIKLIIRDESWYMKAELKDGSEITDDELNKIISNVDVILK